MCNIQFTQIRSLSECFSKSPSRTKKLSEDVQAHLMGHVYIHISLLDGSLFDLCLCESVQ